MQKCSPESNLQESAAQELPKPEAVSLYCPIVLTTFCEFCNPKLLFAAFTDVLLELLTIGVAFNSAKQLFAISRLEDFTVYFQGH